MTLVRVAVAAACVKAVTVGLLLFAATHTDWERFADKAMVARAVAYPMALAIVPLGWWLLRRRGRGRPPAYPALADLLLSVPFAVDVLGNAVDAYDRIGWFDDAAHFVNWALLMGALAVSLSPRLPPPAQVGLVVGLGSTTALLWELAEYQAFIRGGTELATAYRDTLGDMTLGTLGSLAAALVTVRLRAAASAPA